MSTWKTRTEFGMSFNESIDQLMFFIGPQASKSNFRGKWRNLCHSASAQSFSLKNVSVWKIPMKTAQNIKRRTLFRSSRDLDSGTWAHEKNISTILFLFAILKWGKRVYYVDEGVYLFPAIIVLLSCQNFAFPWSDWNLLIISDCWEF